MAAAGIAQSTKEFGDLLVDRESADVGRVARRFRWRWGVSAGVDAESWMKKPLGVSVSGGFTVNTSFAG